MEIKSREKKIEFYRNWLRSLEEGLKTQTREAQEYMALIQEVKKQLKEVENENS